jgi:hypothetical protein
MMRFVLSVCLVFALSLTAWAEEKITRYDVDIDVQENGGLIVTETLDVIAEGNQIRRGIFREMPRFYEFMGVKLENNYEIIYIRRDDRDENYAVLEDGNAQTWRIGNRDIILEPGPYKYEIKYRLEEQVRRHRGDGTSLGNRDEVYWNAIGAYWNFPIEAANVRVNFPQGAEVIDTNAITGRYGATESAAAHSGRGSQAR